MSNPFAERMLKKNDEELIKILTSPVGDYQSDAIEAARYELSKRNISNEKFNIISDHVVTERNESNRKANEALPITFKILAFFFPGVLQLWFSKKFRKTGFDRKVDELLRWTILGFCFYTVLTITVISFTR